MVTRALLVISLCAAPQVVYAEPILELVLEIGEVRFGSDIVEHQGERPVYFDVFGMGSEWNLGGSDVTLSMNSFGLLEKTHIPGPTGTVVQSEYRYAPGSLLIVFDKLVSQIGMEIRESFSGTFSAPVTDIQIVVNEEVVFGILTYTLGEGVFSPELAQGLGVRRKTEGGRVEGGMVSGVLGSYLDTERVGPDADAAVQIDIVAVTEPSRLLMLAAAASLLACRTVLPANRPTLPAWPLWRRLRRKN